MPEGRVVILGFNAVYQSEAIQEALTDWTDMTGLLALPAMTRVVIGMSDFLVGYWWAVIAAAFGTRRLILRPFETLVAQANGNYAMFRPKRAE